jgi:hypothetical protein
MQDTKRLRTLSRTIGFSRTADFSAALLYLAIGNIRKAAKNLTAKAFF